MSEQDPVPAPEPVDPGPAEPVAPAAPDPIDLAALAAAVDWPDGDAERATRERVGTLDIAPQGLGRLEDLAVWAAGVQGATPPHELRRVRLVLIGGDHGVAQREVSVRAAGRTGDDLVRAATGRGVSGVLADITGAGMTAVDVSVTAPSLSAQVVSHHVRDGSGAIDVEDALTEAEYQTALEAGIALADAEIDAGADLLVLGDVGTGSTTAAATLISLVTGTEPVKVVGRGSGIDDDTWMRKVAAIRDARRRGLAHHNDAAGMLRVVGGADLTVMVALLLRAAGRRTPVLLDGVVSAAAALVAREQAPRGIRWWRAAHRSNDPGHSVAVDRLRLDPVLDLDLALGGGAGAMLAVPLVQAAVRLVAELDVDPARQARPVADEPSEFDVNQHVDADQVRPIDEPIGELAFRDVGRHRHDVEGEVSTPEPAEGQPPVS